MCNRASENRSKGCLYLGLLKEGGCEYLGEGLASCWGINLNVLLGTCCPLLPGTWTSWTWLTSAAGQPGGLCLGKPARSAHMCAGWAAQWNDAPRTEKKTQSGEGMINTMGLARSPDRIGHRHRWRGYGKTYSPPVPSCSCPCFLDPEETASKAARQQIENKNQSVNQPKAG